MNKKLTISIPILIAIIVSVVVTTIMMNNKESDKDPNLSPETNQSIDNEEMTMDKVYININNKKLGIDLENNSTTSALIKLLPLELSMNDLNGNEKYVYLDKSLSTNSFNPRKINSGDIMLFGDNCLVIFYKSFDTSYSYTKIGHIDHLDGLILSDVSLEIDEDFDRATEEERAEVIKMYLESLDLCAEELTNDVNSDEDGRKLADAIRFIESVKKGETIVESVPYTDEEFEELKAKFKQDIENAEKELNKNESGG